MDCLFWNYFSFCMVIYQFRSITAASSKCVYLNNRMTKLGQWSKLGHATPFAWYINQLKLFPAELRWLNDSWETIFFIRLQVGAKLWEGTCGINSTTPFFSNQKVSYTYTKWGILEILLRRNFSFAFGNIRASPPPPTFPPFWPKKL